MINGYINVPTEIANILDKALEEFMSIEEEHKNITITVKGALKYFYDLRDSGKELIISHQHWFSEEASYSFPLMWALGVTTSENTETIFLSTVYKALDYLGVEMGVNSMNSDSIQISLNKS